MSSWQRFFEEEINEWWCLGDTWKCTPVEAMGLWSVVFFVFWVMGGTVVHLAVQSEHGTADRNDARTRKHTDQDDQPRGWCALVLLLLTAIAGTVLMVCMNLQSQDPTTPSLGVRWVHPFQSWCVQLLGVAILLVCCVAFVTVHVSMAENWSPEPEAKKQHGLVTSGLFRWARHPMYAVFLWAAIGSALATINWVVALYTFAMFWYTWLRIPTEERILVDLFGDDYCEYCSRVPALGVPWGCLDRCLPVAQSGELHGVLLAGADA